jgi:hypothetical protein
VDGEWPKRSGLVQIAKLFDGHVVPPRNMPRRCHVSLLAYSSASRTDRQGVAKSAQVCPKRWSGACRARMADDSYPASSSPQPRRSATTPRSSAS